MKAASSLSQFRALAWNLGVARAHGVLGLAPAVPAVLIAILFAIPTGGLQTPRGPIGFSSGLTPLASPVGGNGSGNSSSLAANSSFSLSPSTPLPPPSTIANWPTYDQNPQRTGANSLENTLASTNASGMVRQWARSLDGGVFGSLAVVNGSVYVGDFHGNETQLYASNGTKHWGFQYGGPNGNVSWTHCFAGKNNIRGISATATVWNGMVFFPGGDKHLYAVYASNGTVVPGWPVLMTNHTNDSWNSFFPYGSPLVHNSSVFIGTSSGCDSPLVQGQLLQVSVATHKITHIFNVTANTGGGGGIWSTPSVQTATNSVWITTGNPASVGNWSEAVVKLDGSNVCHAVLGNCTAKGYYHVSAPGAVDDDFGAGATVYFLANGTPMVVTMNKNGKAMAFYANTLKADGTSSPAWNRTISNPSALGLNVAPAAFNGTAIFLGGTYATVNGTQCTGTISAVNPTDGSLRWEKCTPGFVRAGITYADGLVVDAADTVGNRSSTVEVRNSSTGAVVASISVNQTVTGQPVIANGRLFFGTGNWTTFCGNTTQHPCPRGYVDAYGLPLGNQGTYFHPYNLNPVGPDVRGFANATGGMPTYNYTWNWGDGSLSNGRYSSHAYGATYSWVGQRNFTGVVTVTDAAGGAKSQWFYVQAWEDYSGSCHWVIGFCWHVLVAPCYFAYCINIVRGPIQALEASAYLIGAIGAVTWDWNWGDGTSDSTVQYPSHTYASHSTYTITVTATDSEHRQATKTIQVTV
jgi:outer membrane protein assembly factor BamB